MIGGKLEGRCGLFLADIFLDQIARHQILGGIKGILLFIIDVLDIDGRQTVLLAYTLYQLHCPLELAGRAELVAERRIHILFDIAHVSTAINGSLKACGIKGKIKLQNTRLDVDLCDRRASVMEAVGSPTDAVFGTLVGKQSVFQLAVIFLDVGTRLDQLCFKALAVVRHDVATRVLVKADDTLVACKAVAVGIVFFVVLVILVSFCVCTSFGFFQIVLVINLVLVVRVFFVIRHIGSGKSGNTCIGVLLALFFLGFRFIALLALLQFVIEKIRKLFHHRIGRRVVLLLGGGGGRRFLVHFFISLGHDLFHDLIGACAVSKGRFTLGRHHGRLRLCDGLNRRNSDLRLFGGSLGNLGFLRKCGKGLFLNDLVGLRVSLLSLLFALIREYFFSRNERFTFIGFIFLSGQLGSRLVRIGIPILTHFFLAAAA